jgi:NAD(P)-dependent dehydrogenase (short-subunit alcohol dehydrogenase family)
MGCLAATWNAARAAVQLAFLPGEAGGRILLVAPADGAEHAAAATAGLENLARTLSIEWARYGITTVAVAPGEETRAEDVAAVIAYLASPAGAYFSGCLMDLRGPVA